MTTGLEIRDGNPYYYLSPDILTVPGDDPDLSNLGFPVPGQPCYLYARVKNHDRVPVVDAQVNYYWANPAVGVSRTTAYPIGTAFVSLPAGADALVLCLTPWDVQFVNEGHVCLVVEAFTQGTPVPSADFAVPIDPRVAQRNLVLVQAAKSHDFLWTVPIEVHNPTSSEQRIVLLLEPGHLSELEELQEQLAKFKLPRTDGKLAGFAFVDNRCPRQSEVQSAPQEIDIILPAGKRHGVFVAGQSTEGVTLVHVLQHFPDLESFRPGGVSILADARC